jgi:drug/metabolite transporter (DMT)-like permease
MIHEKKVWVTNTFWFQTNDEKLAYFFLRRFAIFSRPQDEGTSFAFLCFSLFLWFLSLSISLAFMNSARAYACLATETLFVSVIMILF